MVKSLTLGKGANYASKNARVIIVQSVKIVTKEPFEKG